MKNLSKLDLIKLAKERGFFKKEAIQVMYARSNGHFYYIKPPMFADGHETFKIKRKDISGTTDSGSDAVEYPLNMKETVKLIKALKNKGGVSGLIESGQLLKDDSRAGVIKSLDSLSDEPSTDDTTGGGPDPQKEEK